MPEKVIDETRLLSTSELAQMHQMEVLLRISRTAAALETLDEILVQLVEVISSELHAERSTIFLNDAETQELYSRVAQGNMRREIRILNTSGLAGHVFTRGEGVIVDDAYADERFNRSIDEQTGFVTRNLICVPIRIHLQEASRHLSYPRSRPCGGQGKKRARGNLRGAGPLHRRDIPEPDGSGEPFPRRSEALSAAAMGCSHGVLQPGAGVAPQ